MPAFTKLSERISGDEKWRVKYNSLLDDATQVANKVPLIHVSRWGEWLFLDPPHEVSISDCSIPESRLPQSLRSNPEGVAYCSPTTREIEKLLGFGPSVYFYAG